MLLLPHDLDGSHVGRPPVPLHPVHLAMVYLEGLYMLHAYSHLSSRLIEQFYRDSASVRLDFYSWPPKSLSLSRWTS